jgi:hypothetical protein
MCLKVHGSTLHGTSLHAQAKRYKCKPVMLVSPPRRKRWAVAILLVLASLLHFIASCRAQWLAEYNELTRTLWKAIKAAKGLESQQSRGAPDCFETLGKCSSGIQQGPSQGRQEGLYGGLDCSGWMYGHRRSFQECWKRRPGADQRATILLLGTQGGYEMFWRIKRNGPECYAVFSF